MEVGDGKRSTGNMTWRDWFGRSIIGEEDQCEDVVAELREEGGWRRAFQANGEELSFEAWGKMKRTTRDTRCSSYSAKAMLESTGNARGKRDNF